MSYKKNIVHIAKNIPYSIAYFYEAVEYFPKIGVVPLKIDRTRREIITENLYIRFMCMHQNMDGLYFDEMFGESNSLTLMHLKSSNKPRFSGSLIEYIKKIECDDKDIRKE